MPSCLRPPPPDLTPYAGRKSDRAARRAEAEAAAADAATLAADPVHYIDALRDPIRCRTCGNLRRLRDECLHCGAAMGARAEARAIAIAEARDAAKIAAERERIARIRRLILDLSILGIGIAIVAIVAALVPDALNLMGAAR